MAELGNIYDALAEEKVANRQTGLDYSKIREGGVAAAVMAQAGGMLGGAAMEAAGYQTPAQAKQQARQEVQAMFPNPTTYSEMVQMANALKNLGQMDDYQQIMEMADDMKPTKTSSDETPDMKNIRDKAKFDLRCDINDPAIIKDGKNCYQLASESHLKVKRVGQEETGLKAGVESFQKTIAGTRENQKTLRTNLLTLGNLKSLVPQIYTGTGQGAVAAWNQIGTVLGFTEATNAQAATEAFRSGGLEVAMQYINATKGAVSDMEMKKFIDASPNLHNTQLGNLFIIEFAMARQKREQKLLSAMNRFSLKYPGATSAQWNNEEDRLINTEEYDISKKLQKAYDAAKNDPKYTGLETNVVLDGDASNDTQTLIDNLPPL